jgi:hypothetical protein
LRPAHRNLQARLARSRRVATRRQRLLGLLERSEQGLSPRDLALALDVQERTVLDDLQHLRRSLRRSGHVLQMQPARCSQCGWQQEGEEPRNPSRCPRCKATRLHDARFRVAPR